MFEKLQQGDLAQCQFTRSLNPRDCPDFFPISECKERTWKTMVRVLEVSETNNYIVEDIDTQVIGVASMGIDGKLFCFFGFYLPYSEIAREQAVETLKRMDRGYLPPELK